IVLDRGREFLAGHQEITVAGKGDDCSLRRQTLHSDRRRDTIAHRARDRGELRSIAPVARVAVHPNGEITSAVADHRIGGKLFAQAHDDLAEVDRSRNRGGLVGTGEEVGVRSRRLLAPPELVWRLESFQCGCEGGWRGVYRQMWPVHPAKFFDT